MFLQDVRRGLIGPASPLLARPYTVRLYSVYKNEIPATTLGVIIPSILPILQALLLIGDNPCRM